MSSTTEAEAYTVQQVKPTRLVTWLCQTGYVTTNTIKYLSKKLTP